MGNGFSADAGIDGAIIGAVVEALAAVVVSRDPRLDMETGLVCMVSCWLSGISIFWAICASCCEGFGGPALALDCASKLEMAVALGLGLVRVVAASRSCCSRSFL